MKKIIIGIFVSCAFIWFALKDVDTDQVVRLLSELNFHYFPVSVFLFLIIMFIRSVRWAVILSPIERLNQRSVFLFTCIGYMAISILPLRLGEFMRPYLLSTKSNIPLSSGLATIFVERVLDAFVILLMLFVFIVQSDLPKWLIQAGYSFFVTVSVLTCILLLLYLKGSLRMSLISALLNRLPAGIGTKLESVFSTFIKGFGILSSYKRLGLTIALSVLVWVLSAVAVFSLYYCQNLDLPLTSAFIILIVVSIGVSVPTAPGFLGNFQFACILGLSIYDIPKNEALVFSLLFYAMTVGFNILLGGVALPFVKLSFEDIKKSIRLQKV